MRRRRAALRRASLRYNDTCCEGYTASRAAWHGRRPDDRLLVVMGALKSIAKRALVPGFARVAALRWKWRRPGSLLVLAYHRVLPENSPARMTEQPGMYVSPETLDLHLSELTRNFELVHLNDWLRRAKGGATLPKLACAITFDDGWADNWEFALPILVKYGAPVTIFLVSGYVGTAHRYWPNQLMNLLQKAFADPGSVAFPQSLDQIVQPILTETRSRGELRLIDADRAVQRAKRFEEGTIRSLIAAAWESSGDRGHDREILSQKQVVDMAATGLVRFGSHTMTHFRLGAETSVEVLEREIVGSREQVEDMCKVKVDLFCYPNGETSSQAIEIVRRNYLGAVCTRKGWHFPGDDSYLIRRMGLHEDASKTRDWFIARVSGWI